MSDGDGDGDRREEPFTSIDDRDGDPFERIDQSDRGDPFEELSEDPQSREGAPIDSETDQAGSEADSESNANSESDRFDRLVDEQSTGGRGEDPSESGASGKSFDATIPVKDSTDDPFEQMGRNEREDDPFEQLEERSGGERPAADEDLWESLSRSQTEPETERRGQRRYAEVSKHSYCEGCEYFSAPPDVACAHEGTDIIEFVDSETVRVADCPIVAERERLTELDSGR